MKTHVEIYRQNLIGAKERSEMYEIFSSYYENTNHTQFKMDFKAKNWIIVLRDDQKRIAGFSTISFYNHTPADGTETIKVIYSGDTIIAKNRRNTTKFAGGFGSFLLKMIELSNDTDLYWFLTSKGARTYRVLPVFFNEFYPVHDHPTPRHIKRLIDQLALSKYGTAYNPKTQVVTHFSKNDRLCCSEQISPMTKRVDPHIHFFHKLNPGFTTGNELVCLTPISMNNINESGHRAIQNTEVVWYE